MKTARPGLAAIARVLRIGIDAIAVAGWWGVITLGILLPLAWIWAYTKPVAQPPAAPDAPAGTADAESAS